VLGFYLEHWVRKNRLEGIEGRLEAAVLLAADFFGELADPEVNEAAQRVARQIGVREATSSPSGCWRSLRCRSTSTDLISLRLPQRWQARS
jgi:hypothetical protein